MGGMEIIAPIYDHEQKMGGMDIINPVLKPEEPTEMLMGGMNIINPVLLPESNNDGHNLRVLDENKALCSAHDYHFDEAPLKNKCTSDCDCDGLRTCSQWGWCKGTSRSPVEQEEARANSKPIEDAWSKIVKGVLSVAEKHSAIDQDEDLEESVEELMKKPETQHKQWRYERKSHDNDDKNEKHLRKRDAKKDAKKAGKKHHIKGGERAWKKRDAKRAKRAEKPAAQKDAKPYGFGSGGAWSVDVKPLHH
jgi:hypothetical protein